MSGCLSFLLTEGRVFTNGIYISYQSYIRLRSVLTGWLHRKGTTKADNPRRTVLEYRGGSLRPRHMLSQGLNSFANTSDLRSASELHILYPHLGPHRCQQSLIHSYRLGDHLPVHSTRKNLEPFDSRNLRQRVRHLHLWSSHESGLGHHTTDIASTLCLETADEFEAQTSDLGSVRNWSGVSIQDQGYQTYILMNLHSACISSLMRLIYSIQIFNSTDATWLWLPLALWWFAPPQPNPYCTAAYIPTSQAEITSGILCNCLPCMPRLLQHLLRNRNSSTQVSSTYYVNTPSLLKKHSRPTISKSSQYVSVDEDKNSGNDSKRTEDWVPLAPVSKNNDATKQHKGDV